MIHPTAVWNVNQNIFWIKERDPVFQNLQNGIAHFFKKVSVENVNQPTF